MRKNAAKTYHFLKTILGSPSFVNPKLIFPFYHSVSDSPAPHYKHLFKVRSEEEFRTDLDFLCQYFEPLTLERAIKHDGTKPAFHLSFDDGFSECYDVIAPILLERKIPATFFLNPAFLDNRQIMHRCLASLMIERIPARRQEWLSYRFTDRDRLMELAQGEGVEIEEYLMSQSPYLSIDEAKKLAKMGFSIGSHSIDHPEFPLVSEEEQVRQIRESQSLLEVMLDMEIPVFAFPFEDLDVDPNLFLLLAHHYEASFGTSGIKQDPRPHHFQRLDMEKAVYGGPELIEASYFFNWLR